MKLAIIDLDGVVANAEARFAHAEEVKQTYLYPDGKDAVNAYWCDSSDLAARFCHD